MALPPLCLFAFVLLSPAESQELGVAWPAEGAVERAADSARAALPNTALPSLLTAEVFLWLLIATDTGHYLTLGVLLDVKQKLVVAFFAPL